MKTVLSQDHQGMKISARGLLKATGTGAQFSRLEMLKHLEESAKRFYAGEIEVMDEFFQLYCIGEDQRKAAKALAQGETK